jgi:hypothetical protein
MRGYMIKTAGSIKVSKKIVAFGMVGIIAVLITMISDLILLGRPDSGLSFFLYPTESMVGIPDWRITVGTFLGVIMLPFQIFGIVPACLGLKPCGKAVQITAGIAGGHGLIMGAAFHTTYAFMADGWKLYHSAGSEAFMVTSLIRNFEYYWKLILVIMTFDLMLFSVIYVFYVLSGKSAYPRWMAVFNPAVIMAVIFPIMLLIPAPVGGFAAPVVLNLSTLVFFSVSTAVIYKATHPCLQ